MTDCVAHSKAGRGVVLLAWWIVAAALRAEDVRPLRVGMIGLDTSHAVAFAKLLCDPTDRDHIPGVQLVAAYAGGSPDIPASRDRILKFTDEITNKFRVPLAESIEHLCQQVDAVLLTSVDGRVHLRQARPVLAARKPLFVDKPMAASLADALVMFELARRHRAPIMSSSALRFGRTTQEVRAGAIGKVLKAETFCPVHLEPTHPELFWYGIHGIEALFTVMGPGCRTVRRGMTEDGRIEVVGTWADGRTGIFRQAPGNKGYGGRAVGERGESEIGTYDGYAPLLREVIQFFRTGVSPIPEQETVEILAFMEAAEESRLNQGAVVELEAVVRRARELAARQLEGEPRTNP